MGGMEFRAKDRIRYQMKPLGYRWLEMLQDRLSKSGLDGVGF